MAIAPTSEVNSKPPQPWLDEFMVKLEADAIEAYIDFEYGKKILTEPAITKRRSITIDHFSDSIPSKGVMAELLKRYSSVGWKRLEFDSDYREQKFWFTLTR